VVIDPNTKFININSIKKTIEEAEKEAKIRAKESKPWP
jgi:hypothetical protein